MEARTLCTPGNGAKKKKKEGVSVVQVKLAGTMGTVIKNLQPLLNSFVLKYVSSE